MVAFFNITIVILYALGWLGSAFFMATWTPLAVRALVRRRDRVSVVTILDYAGIMGGIFVFVGLQLIKFYVDGVSPVGDWFDVVRRIGLGVTLNGLAVIRVAQWGRALWSARHHARERPDPVTFAQ